MLKEIIKNFLKFKERYVESIWVKIRFIKYKKYCIKNNQKEYLMFATPIHGNLGDQAIIYAEQKFLNDLSIKIFEIPTYKKNAYMKVIEKYISKQAIILIHGGGFLGTQWFSEEEFVRNVISKYNNHQIIIFPQTIYYEDTDFGKEELEKSINIYNQENITICAREKISYNRLKEIYKNANILLVPDIVLYLDKYISNENRKGILLCLRNDKEKSIKEDDTKEIETIAHKFYDNVKYTDTVINKKVNPKKREKYLIKKFKEICLAELIITDRLHGMVFAAITQTPCIVMSNCNHKVKGVYEWIKDLKYVSYIESVNELEETIKKIKEEKDINYDSKNKEFEELKSIIKGEK